MRQEQPAYLRLYDQLRQCIVSGDYPFGSRLPSKRVLAERSGTSVITVEHALAMLNEEGFIESRERSGCFVCFRKGDVFAPGSGAPQSPRIRSTADIGEQTFPFGVLSRTMRKVLSDYGENILTKAPNAGCGELRSAISLYLARGRGIHVSPEQIVIGSGAEYLYGLIVEMLGSDQCFGIEMPSYKKIEQVYLSRGVRYELLPLGNDGIPDDVLNSSRATVLHISPYRSFPSGVTASASRKHAYAQWAQSGGRFIIEDDFESEFSLLSRPEETVFSLSDRTILLNTFSMTISPSIRAGYMVLPEVLTERFSERVGFYSCTVPCFEQYVLAELINSGDFERHINRVRRRKRRETQK